NEINCSFRTIEVERLTVYELFVVPLFATGVSLGIGSSPNGRVDLIGDEDPTDEDGDTEVSVSLGEIFLEGKKSWESDIVDSNNIGDGADRRVFVLDFRLQSISYVNAATAIILMLLLGFSTIRPKDLCCPSLFWRFIDEVITKTIKYCLFDIVVEFHRWPPKVTLGRLLPHARGLEFKPRHGGFPSGAKKEWDLSPKAKVRVLHTAQLDVTLSRFQGKFMQEHCLFCHHQIGEDC
nr:hypothetical protein [Tanacetum cinerariifolium]